METADDECAVIYMTRVEAAVLRGAVWTGKKHLTAYWNHADFDPNHEKDVVVSMRVMDAFIDVMDKIVDDWEIRATRIVK